MMRFLASCCVAAALIPSLVLADGTTCGDGSQCPEDLPCCSQYGQCGVGAYCLGGCDPLFSHSLDSCMPAPQCSSKTYQLNSLDRIQPNTKYLGDASKADWVSSGSPQPYPQDNPDSILLTMPKNSVGTLLASTEYVWYGKVSAKLKTSRGKGVVTAFILLSDVKDEIDFEFVGVDLNTAQSNYYFQGIPDYTHSKNLTVEDTFDDYHTYEIDWKPDTLTWSIDGETQRTVKKSDTWNATANRFDYPQTPARIQLSLWPAGLSTNAQGTIDWAGGVIDWNAPDVKNAGYYYARFEEVTLECYDPPSGAKGSGTKSYIYDNASGLNNTVELSNDNTVLSSFLGSGLNPKLGASASASGSGSSATAPTVPGLSGAGTGSNGQRGDSGSDSGSSGNSGSQPSGYHGFSQGDNDKNAASDLEAKATLFTLGASVVLSLAGVYFL